MKTLSKILNLTLALTCVSAVAVDIPADIKKIDPASTGKVTPGADNTDINQRDKSGATKTPQDQSNQAEDRQLLASVRRAIVQDKLLSPMADNVKLNVEAGLVTLRGPVTSANEKAQVEAVIRQVNGVKKVDNRLDVTTNTSVQ